MTRRTFSSNGPQCPKCGFVFTPDESTYYETFYTNDTCPECKCEFSVEVEHSTMWATYLPADGVSEDK